MGSNQWERYGEDEPPEEFVAYMVAYVREGLLHAGPVTESRPFTP